MAGIIQRITLLLDEAARRKTERELQDSLKKGTDPNAPTRNLTRIEGALGKLKSVALSVGGAIAAAFALNKIIDFAGASIRAAAESERAWSSLGTTLKNIGFDLRDVQKDVDALAKKLQASTRFDDEAAVQAFNNILQITGDYEKSLGAVSVAADLAAAKQLGLEEAATLVGRAAVGNTTMLERMGIEIAKGADAVEVLRERFKGAAEQEGKTFSGRLQQMRNDFGNLQEALGQVLIDMGGGTSVIDNMGALFRSLTEWVQENTATLRNWGNWVVDTFKIAGESANVLGRWLDLVAAKWNVLAVDLTDPGAFRAAREEVRRLQDELDAAIAGRSGALRQRENRLGGARNRLNDPLAEQNEIAAEEARLRRIGDASARNRGGLGGGDTAEAEKAFAKRISDLKVLATEAGTYRKALQELLVIEEKLTAQIAKGGTADQIAGLIQKRKEVREVTDAAKGLTVSHELAPEMRTVITKPFLPGAGEVSLTFPTEEASIFKAELQEVFETVALGGESASERISGAFGGVFDLLVSEGDNFGAVFGQSMQRMFVAGLSGLAKFAAGKVIENIAGASEQMAKGAAAIAMSIFPPNPAAAAAAAAHFAAAGVHKAAAVKWGLLAGGAGAGAIASGGAGGGGGIGGGAGRDVGREEADEAGRRRTGPEIHIHVDGFESNNPRHQAELARGVQNIFDRYGMAVILNGSGPT